MDKPKKDAVLEVPEAELEQKTDEIAKKLADNVVQAVRQKIISALDPAPGLGQEAESLMEGHKLLDEERGHLRKMLDGLPVEGQAMWLKTYFDAKAYALTQEDLKNRPREYAGRTAWASVKQRFQKMNDEWRGKGTSITFDASLGKWMVDHRHFLLPIVTASKEEAEALLKIVARAQKPEVKTGDGKFNITHPDWEEPVVTPSIEEARDIVARKLRDEGWSETESSSAAMELVGIEKKEKIMGSIEVKADTKQVPQKGEVSGISTDEGASSPKNQPPAVGGKVSVEGQPGKAVPKAEAHAQEIRTDYEAEARGMDKLVKQVQQHKGMLKTTAAISDRFGADVVIQAQEEGFEALRQKFVKKDKFDSVACMEAMKGKVGDANAYSDWLEHRQWRGASVQVTADDPKMTPEAQKFVSDKIATIRTDHPDWPEERAVAAAYSMARERGFDVPEASK